MLLWERKHGEFAGEFYERNQGGNVVIAEDTVYSVSTNTLPLDIDGLMVTGVAGRDVLITARDLQSGTLRWHRVLGSD
ncbi:MAG: hypothetical protein GWN84_12590, partial [Gammaproteobacteria bacterium]|nr:hypothetical protein [Gammaproteobacteria bacterium]NIR83738.1 hypothetical protein [Gammaproteobacteria bacterium]NIU04906.1 hypothetical protein [Gammaproteobacteria bacterium]NIV51892.1 hypothetical protein [Gammaproteobacteria bacterium]NIX86180.1 hypothetical protein [Gammaproteobacteria bacterium]